MHACVCVCVCVYESLTARMFRVVKRALYLRACSLCLHVVSSRILLVVIDEKNIVSDLGGDIAYSASSPCRDPRRWKSAPRRRIRKFKRFDEEEGFLINVLFALACCVVAHPARRYRWEECPESFRGKIRLFKRPASSRGKREIASTGKAKILQTY